MYFDNLSVTHTRGHLLSEEGYYPFGLAMNALASHAGAVTNNAYKYNAGTELTEDLDADYYETYMRQYDAQVGRFTGVDVLSEMSFNISTYAYAANNPISFSDPSGAVKAADGSGGSDYSDAWAHLLGPLWNSEYGGSFNWDDGYNYFSGGGGGSSGSSGSSGGNGSSGGFGGGSTGAGPTGGGGGGGGQTYTYSTGKQQWGDGTDLDKDPHRSSFNSWVYGSHTGANPSKRAYNHFNNAFNAGSDADNDPDFSAQAQQLKDHFLHGNQEVLSMGTGAIAMHVLNSPQFKDATSRFEAATRKYYSDNGSLDGYIGNLEIQRDKPGYFSPTDDIGLTTVIGGYKAFTSTVTVANNQLTFTYSLWDVFGAGHDDANKWYIPGLPGLYYLENYGNLPGCTLMPFVWYVEMPSPW